MFCSESTRRSAHYLQNPASRISSPLPSPCVQNTVHSRTSSLTALRGNILSGFAQKGGAVFGALLLQARFLWKLIRTWYCGSDRDRVWGQLPEVTSIKLCCSFSTAVLPTLGSVLQCVSKVVHSHLFLPSSGALSANATEITQGLFIFGDPHHNSKLAQLLWQHFVAAKYLFEHKLHICLGKRRFEATTLPLSLQTNCGSENNFTATKSHLVQAQMRTLQQQNVIAASLQLRQWPPMMS